MDSTRRRNSACLSATPPGGWEWTAKDDVNIREMKRILIRVGFYVYCSISSFASRYGHVRKTVDERKQTVLGDVVEELLVGRVM